VFQTRKNDATIERVHDQPQVGEHVLHLAALEERQPAHDLVRHAVLAQLGLERARLGVRAVEHGTVREASPARLLALEPVPTRRASAVSSGVSANTTGAPASRSHHSVFPFRATLCAITAFAASRMVFVLR
jgi:hypothetical protein